MRKKVHRICIRQKGNLEPEYRLCASMNPHDSQLSLQFRLLFQALCFLFQVFRRAVLYAYKFCQSHTAGIKYNPCTRTSRVPLYKCAPTVNDYPNSQYSLSSNLNYFPTDSQDIYIPICPIQRRPSIRSHSVLFCI